MYDAARSAEKDHGGPNARAQARARHHPRTPPPAGAAPRADQAAYPDAHLARAWVVGYRVFAKHTDEPLLESPYQGDDWEGGTATAQRMSDEEGGLYAHHSLELLADYERRMTSRKIRGERFVSDRITWDGQRWLVPAIVTAHGDMYVTAGGLRAEHLTIRAVATRPAWSRHERRRWKAWLARRYGAIVLDPLTENHARQWGHPVPPDLRPADHWL